MNTLAKIVAVLSLIIVIGLIIVSVSLNKNNAEALTPLAAETSVQSG